jgi:hypothetical protein
MTCGAFETAFGYVFGVGAGVLAVLVIATVLYDAFWS